MSSNVVNADVDTTLSHETYVITPDPTRDTGESEYHYCTRAMRETVYLMSYDSAGLMVHFEDIDGNPIMDSFALKMKNPLTSFEDLLQTTFVVDPNYYQGSDRLKIPSNVHSITVSGLLRKYTSETMATNAFGITQPEYIPTVGMTSYNNTYSKDTKYSLSRFDFKTSVANFEALNDVVKSITFIDGKFDHLETTRPIVEIGDVETLKTRY